MVIREYLSSFDPALFSRGDVSGKSSLYIGGEVDSENASARKNVETPTKLFRVWTLAKSQKYWPVKPPLSYRKRCRATTFESHEQTACFKNKTNKIIENRTGLKKRFKKYTICKTTGRGVIFKKIVSSFSHIGIFGSRNQKQLEQLDYHSLRRYASKYVNITVI